LFAFCYLHPTVPAGAVVVAPAAVAPVVGRGAVLFILGLIRAGILFRTMPPEVILTVAFPGSNLGNGFCGNKIKLLHLLRFTFLCCARHFTHVTKQLFAHSWAIWQRRMTTKRCSCLCIYFCSLSDLPLKFAEDPQFSGVEPQWAGRAPIRRSNFEI